jgi:hypothetical protein
LIKRLPYSRTRKNYPPIIPGGGGIGRRGTEKENEVLTGTVKGFKASAGEERAANALNQNPKVNNFFFRMTIGAERHMPGFKELDYLIEAATGMYYAVEVDSLFTHRNKGTSDILHDAIVLENLKHLDVYPRVIHWDIDRDLPDRKTAEQTVKNLVG